MDLRNPISGLARSVRVLQARGLCGWSQAGDPLPQIGWIVTQDTLSRRVVSVCGQTMRTAAEIPETSCIARLDTLTMIARFSFDIAVMWILYDLLSRNRATNAGEIS